jgi:hypothetical protein
MFSLQYTIERISAAISCLSTNCWVLYTTFAVNNRAQYPVYAMSNVVPVKSNISTFLDVQASIFNRTYLRSDWCFIDKSMRVILLTCCPINRVSSCFHYVNNGPGQTKYSYISCYSGINIQMNISPPIMVKCRQFIARYTPHSLPNTGHNIWFTLCQLWSRSYPMQLQFLIFRLQNSIERISAEIGDFATNRCSLYSTFASK